MKKGMLLVVSGPSGVGKGTVCLELKNHNHRIVHSISATTRNMRNGEAEGISYFYISHKEFEDRIEKNEFLEYAKVHDNLYGTPKKFVLDNINDGKVVILEIDVQGAMKVKENFPEGVFVFILPPSMEELKSRLTGRATESDEQVELRLKNAIDEIKMVKEYQYAIVNNKIEDTVKGLESIISAEGLKVVNNTNIEDILLGGKND